MSCIKCEKEVREERENERANLRKRKICEREERREQRGERMRVREEEETRKREDASGGREREGERV
jgi:hypothetical protein